MRRMLTALARTVPGFGAGILLSCVAAEPGWKTWVLWAVGFAAAFVLVYVLEGTEERRRG